MEIILIRHTSVDVPSGVCYGQTDVPLRDTFEQEAAVTSAKLQQILTEGKDPDCIYTSPLTRCTRLATYCGYPDAKRDDRLKEINLGKWEMQEYDKIVDPRLEEWYADYLNVEATGGESYAILHKRVNEFLEELKQQNHERVVIFAHGGVLICAQVYAGVLTPEKGLSAVTPYGGIVRINI